MEIVPHVNLVFLLAHLKEPIEGHLPQKCEPCPCGFEYCPAGLRRGGGGGFKRKRGIGNPPVLDRFRTYRFGAPRPESGWVKKKMLKRAPPPRRKPAGQYSKPQGQGSHFCGRWPLMGSFRCANKKTRLTWGTISKIDLEVVAWPPISKMAP